MSEQENKRRILMGGSVVILIILGITFFSERGLLKARKLTLERDLIVTQARLLENENKKLAKTAQLLRTDMQTIERAARSELNLVREDEILYKFIDK